MQLDPKYSLVIPTLNGKEKIKLSLKSLLNIKRNDIEIVISDNLSNDGTEEFVRSLNSKYIKLIKPSKRLTAGENLSFVISFAKGDWITHMGDDDSIVPSRYDYFDKLIDSDDDIEIIKTNWIKYYWHDYPQKNLANCISAHRSYTYKHEKISSLDYFKNNINNPFVDGGNCWLISKNLIKKVEQKYGYFCHPQNLEFFFIRACLLESNNLINVDIPFAISGSHKSSSSSIYNKSIKSDWNWDFEDKKVFKYSPIKTKNYISISFDGLMRSISIPENKYLLKELDLSRWAFFFTNSNKFHMDLLRFLLKLSFFDKIKFLLRILKNKNFLFKKKHKSVSALTEYSSSNIFELTLNIDDKIKDEIS